MKPPHLIQSTALARRKRANEQHPCDVPGCRGQRHSIFPTCAFHTARKRRYGHATGTPVRPPELAPWRSKVRALVAANTSHPGLVEASKHVSRWLEHGPAQEVIRGKGSHRRKACAVAPGRADDWARLQRHGVTALDILAEAAAVMCLDKYNPRRFRTAPELHFAVSRAVLALAPLAQYQGTKGVTRHRAHSYGSLSTIGARIVEDLGPLLANIARTVEDEAKQAAQLRDAFREPFSPPVRELQKQYGTE